MSSIQGEGFRAVARSGPVSHLRDILHQCKLLDARFKDTVLVTKRILHLIF